MFNYLKQLIRTGSGESSKRFIALYSLFLLTIVIVLYCFDFKIPVDIIYALVSLVLGTSSMTLINNKNNGSGGTSYYNPTQYTPENNNPPKPIKIGNNQEEDLSAENDRISEII